MTNAEKKGQDQTNSNLWLALVLAIGLVSRVGAVLLMQEGLHRDTDAYRVLAETLRNTGTYGFKTNLEQSTSTALESQPVPSRTPVRPTAFRPPLYPMLLSVLVVDGRLSPFAIGSLNVACGMLTVYGVWLLGRSWGLGNWAATAAILTALDPILLYQSTQIMTETLATLCSVVCLLGLTHWNQRPSIVRGILAGLLMAFACLCRPTFLPWSGLVIASSWSLEMQGSPKRKLVAPLLLGIVVGIFPWGLRNYLQLGHWKFTTTHGGYTLLLGNNSAYYQFLRDANWGAVWDSKDLDRAWTRRSELRNANDDLFALAQPHLPGGSVVMSHEPAGRTEFDDDQLAYDFARRYIRDDRPMFLYSCLHRVGSLWQVLPHQVTPDESSARRFVRWAIAGWYCIVFGLALAGCWRIRDRVWRAPWLWGLLLCVVFTSVHAFYWSNMRMRAPLMPFVALLAASSLVKSGSWLRSPERGTT